MQYYVYIYICMSWSLKYDYCKISYMDGVGLVNVNVIFHFKSAGKSANLPCRSHVELSQSIPGQQTNLYKIV